MFFRVFFLKSRMLHASYVPCATLIHKQRSEPGKQYLHRIDWRATGSKTPPTFCPFHSEIKHLISNVWYLQVAIYDSNYVSFPCYSCSLFSLQMLHSSPRPNCDFFTAMFLQSLFPFLPACSDRHLSSPHSDIYMTVRERRLPRSSRPPTAPHQWWACPGEAPPHI